MTEETTPPDIITLAEHDDRRKGRQVLYITPQEALGAGLLKGAAVYEYKLVRRVQ